MPRRSTPEDRTNKNKEQVARVRRKYRAKKYIDKPKKLLPGDEQAMAFTCVVLKLAGYSNTDAARVVGISKGQVKAFLETPKAQELLVEMRVRLGEAALELLHGYMIEAVATIADVMRTSPDDKIVLQAAAEILDRGGIPKASRQERQIDNNENITISDDGLVEKLRELPPEEQERAAQIIEELEQLTLEAASGGEVEEQDGAA